MTDSKKKTAAKAAGAVGVGAALAIVITQILDACGVHLGEQIIGPLGVVIGGLISEARAHLGDGNA